ASRDRDRVREVAELRRAFVRRDDEVGIIVVVEHRAIRMDDVFRSRRRIAHDVVSHIEKGVDEDLISVLAGLRQIALRAARAQNEAALRADRDDERVLRPLGLHEAEDLAPEIVDTVAEADAAASDEAASEMDTFEIRARDEDLEARPGKRHARHVLAAHLDRDRGWKRSVLGSLRPVRAHRREDELEEVAKDPILLDPADRLEGKLERLARVRLIALALLGRAIWIESRAEEIDERERRLRIAKKRRVRGSLLDRGLELAQVRGVGPQELDVAVGEPREGDETVQRIIRRPPFENGEDGLLDVARAFASVDRLAVRTEHVEDVKPERRGDGVLDRIRRFVENLEAEVGQGRHEPREAEALAGSHDPDRGDGSALVIAGKRAGP